MKRLSSNFAKYNMLLMALLPIVGLLIAVISSAFDTLFPIVAIVVFMELVCLLLFTSFHDVYYDKEYIYIKPFYKKELNKFPLASIDSISHWMYTGPDIIFINGEKYFFAVSLMLYFKKDILGYIRK